tara:strand:+ start:333 stop:2606 length:2274 start_codon:yes stop_codon:yes gene_type:complete
MHISLDSALGQQRRLNQVGETISSIAAPTAAYSLRSLTGGDPKVVRVRRESDNHEQDFTASDVSSGALVDFVNSQVTAPLDIREIADLDSDGNNDGRVGDFLIAKAAYSLRSLGTRQATVTSSGDTDGDTSGKYVCQVRSVTGDIKSFTADEVSDGTLVDFVLGNTKPLLNNRVYFDGVDDEVSLSSEITLAGDFSIQFSFVVTETEQRIFGKETVARIEPKGTNSIESFVVTMADASGGTLTLTESLKYGEDNTVKFKRVSDNLGIYNESDQLISNEINNTIAFPLSSFGRSRGAFAKCVLHSIRVDTNNDGTIDHSYNGYGNTLSDWQDLVGGNNASAVNGSPALFTGQDQDGFVKTWYDQSVTTQAGDTATGNHATQSTADNQPTIVENGSLLADGLRFDGSNDSMTTTSAISSTNIAIAAVSKSANNATAGIFSMLDGFDDGHEALYLANTMRYALEDSDLDVSTTTTNKNLYFANYDGSTQGLSINGTNSTQSVSKTVATITSVAQIGSRGGSNFLNGSIEEIIVYTDDQSANRTAIEANIGEHYSISGVPASDTDNSVSGFVETWYDQSGNGRDAVQATASKQPKIVNAGTMLNELEFDGSNHQLDFTALNESDISIFSVPNFDDASGQDRILSTASGADSSGFGKGSATAGFFRASSGSASQPSLNATISADQDIVYSFIRASNTGTFFTNGTASSTFSNSTAFKASSIGGHGSKIDGSLKELIIYDSNQTAKRSDLETNIATEYGITLS